MHMRQNSTFVQPILFSSPVSLFTNRKVNEHEETKWQKRKELNYEKIKKNKNKMVCPVPKLPNFHRASSPATFR